MKLLVVGVCKHLATSQGVEKNDRFSMTWGDLWATCGDLLPACSHLSRVGGFVDFSQYEPDKASSKPLKSN